jgi:hypothetical protein
VNDRSVIGDSGYITATMSLGRSCVWMNFVSGSRTDTEFDRRTW